MSQELISKDLNPTKMNLIAQITAELDTQINTAKAYPRTPENCLKEAIFMATIDEDTAAECFYVLNRKTKDEKTGKYVDNPIKGPSIRVAEILMSCWGNIHAGTRIVGNDGKFITAEGFAWDLEKNIRLSAEVKRSITNKSGQTYNADMQVVTANAVSSIALRNGLFKIIPRVFVNKVWEAAAKFAVGDQKSLPNKRQKLFARFKQMGIAEETILSFLGKDSLEQIDLDDVQTLMGIGTAIKDGVVSIDNAFNLNATIDKNTKAMIMNEEVAHSSREQSAESKEFFGEDK